jgi:hypothetical protein
VNLEGSICCSGLLLSSLAFLCRLLVSYPGRLGAIVFDRLLEPCVSKSLFGSDSLGRIVDKDLLKKVEELPIEICVWRDGFLKQYVSGLGSIGDPIGIHWQAKSWHLHVISSWLSRTFVSFEACRYWGNLAAWFL